MQRRNIIEFIIGSLLLVFLTQCGKKEDTVLAPNIAPLVGTWQLTEPDSAYTVTLVLALDTDNPPHDVTPFIASGVSSINEYGARMFAVLDGTMTFDQLSSTKKAGPTQAMTYEQTYFNNLRAVVRYELPTATQLRLHYGGEKPGTLIYKKIK
ncbi:META domain-containing protein [Spirosoma koreense]